MEWTVLIYAAGDNDLHPFLDANLRAWASLPSEARVQVVIQQDGPDGARRMVAHGGTLVTVANLGKVNTGDPAVLTEFLRWGRATYPATRVALFIRGHGSGVRGGEVSVPLFERTVQRLNQQPIARRAIGHDASGDFLDSIELRKALSDGLGGARFNLLAFDACLMGSIEIAFQLRECADWLIASSQTSPGAGWPYQSIVAWLGRNTEAEAPAWADAIAQAYEAMAQTSHTRESPHDVTLKYTLAVVELAHIEALATRLAEIALLLLPNGGNLLANLLVAKGVQKIREKALRFSDADMVDLGSWAQYFLLGIGATAPKVALLAEHLRAVRAAVAPGAGAIRRRVAVDKGGNLIDAAESSSLQVAGLAVYWPREQTRRDYEGLGFAQATHWGRVVRGAVSVEA